MHVILCSGWGKADFMWRKYRRLWAAEGVTTSLLQNKAFGMGPIQPAAKQLARQIDDLKYPPFVVGHSMGGLIARYALGKYPSEIAGLVTIASPLNGSKAAKFAPWSASAHQMRPNSNFLRRCEPLPLPTAPMLNVYCSHDLLVRRDDAIVKEDGTLYAEVPQTHASVLLSTRVWDMIHGFAMDCLGGDIELEYVEEEALPEGDDDE